MIRWISFSNIAPQKGHDSNLKESINGIEVTNMGVIAALVVGMIMGAGAAVIAIVLISEWREDK